MLYCSCTSTPRPIWLGGVVAGMSDSWSRGRGFNSRPLHCRALTLGKLFNPRCLCSPSSIIWYFARAFMSTRLYVATNGMGPMNKGGHCSSGSAAIGLLRTSILIIYFTCTFIWLLSLVCINICMRTGKVGTSLWCHGHTDVVLIVAWLWWRWESATGTSVILRWNTRMGWDVMMFGLSWIRRSLLRRRSISHFTALNLLLYGLPTWQLATSPSYFSASRHVAAHVALRVFLPLMTRWHLSLRSLR